ncbi:MAG: hypothetical protein Q7S20_01260 [Gemmatimonadaceae bacterium]|nr:hypothetical protein [Gemmatimonadaceae bacterium]
MATTKEYQAWLQGVKGRLSLLVKEAGEQKAFCRKVWPSDDADVNKSKVSKWVNGLSGIHPTEVLTVAAAFQRRPAWLLFGELPEREGVTRTEAKLAADLAAYVWPVAIKKAGVKLTEPAGVGLNLGEKVKSMISGETLLQLCVDTLAHFLRDNAAYYSEMHAILGARAALGVTAIRLNRAKLTEDKARLERASAILARFATAPRPAWKVLSWQPVSSTQGAGSPAPARKSRRKNKPTKRRKS